jgi:(1->4)-alpha-D-glucan 1-alpha-D-glucosylmutase
VPVAVEGPRADHLIAFARVLGTAVAIAVGSRLMARLQPPGDGIRVPPAVWTGTRLRLPDDLAAIRLREVLSWADLNGGATIEVGDILRDLPVALLVSR